MTQCDFGKSVISACGHSLLKNTCAITSEDYFFVTPLNPFSWKTAEDFCFEALLFTFMQAAVLSVYLN